MARQLQAKTRSRRRRLWLGLALLFVPLAVFLGAKWKTATDNGGQLPMTPYHIAGNLYYVGTQDVTSFLLTSPDGHVLIDGGYPGTAPLIMQSIAKLGFKITDVKILLNSHAHFDHAGGLAALQKASGAKLWVSEQDAALMRSGGTADPTIGALKVLAYIGLAKYHAPRIDHPFKDGATVRLGSTTLTAHVIGGHTPGCTAWAFPVQEGNRTLQVVHIGSLSLPVSSSLEPEAYPGIRTDYERAFAMLRTLPADIYLASHSMACGVNRKHRESVKANGSIAPFIDPEGYLKHIDHAEYKYRTLLREQQPRGQSANNEIELRAANLLLTYP